MKAPCLQAFVVLVIALDSSLARFSDFYLKEGYDKRDRPGENEGKPMIVFIKIQLHAIRRVEEKNHELEIEIYIQRSWIEDRLVFNASMDDDRYHIVDNTDTDQFWIPDFYVQNMAEFKTDHGNLDLQIFMVNKNKRVVRGQKARMMIRCHFKFELYPLDIQECPLDFMSPLRTERELKMEWWYKDDELPAFFVKDKSQEISLPTHKGRLDVCNESISTQYPWGNVSTVRVWLRLERELKAHLLETYVPTILFVIMSWGSFLVKPEMVPGRMVLLVTNLLSLVTMFEATRSSSPPALGVKSIDVWLLSCILFVFLALLEYAVVLYKMLDSDSRVKKLFKPPTPSSRSSALSKVSQPRQSPPKQKKSLWDPMARKVQIWFQTAAHSMTSQWCIWDKVSMFVFPFLFILYNIVYWSVYIIKRNRRINHVDHCNEIV